MTTFTPKNVARFCEMLAETGQVGKSARAIGVSRMTVWNWRQKHPKFREAWDAALKIATTTLEDEAWRRAHEGNEEPVYHNGECVGMVRKYSDTLLIFLLMGLHNDQACSDRLAYGLSSRLRKRKICPSFRPAKPRYRVSSLASSSPSAESTLPA